MKYVMMVVVLGVAGYFVWQQQQQQQQSKAKAAASATAKAAAAPPPIFVEPSPLVNAEDQARIIKSATDQNPDVRWQAILLLDKMKVPQAYDVMFDRLHHDQDTDLRIKIIGLLSQRGATRTTLQPNPNDPLNPNTVTEAVPRDRREADITKNLAGMVRDFLPEIRIAALQSLDTLGDYAVAPSIMDALRDPDERVRLQALKTLNSLQEKKAAAIEAERKRQEELRRQAAAQKGQ